jgi:hypothetical protein
MLPPWPCQAKTIGALSLVSFGAKTSAWRFTPSTLKVMTVPCARLARADAATSRIANAIAKRNFMMTSLCEQEKLVVRLAW